MEKNHIKEYDDEIEMKSLDLYDKIYISGIYVSLFLFCSWLYLINKILFWLLIGFSILIVTIFIRILRHVE